MRAVSRLEKANILDGSDCDVPLDQSPQVMIVGAGPAGLTLARELAGYDVLLVESGGTRPDQGFDSLCSGHAAGLPYPLHETRSRGVGGSLSLWAGWIAPFDADDFDQHPLRQHSPWPIGVKELGPYYNGAAHSLNLGDLCFDAKTLAAAGRLSLPLDSDLVKPTAWRLGTPTWRFNEEDLVQLALTSGLTVITRAHAVELVLSRSAGEVRAVRLRTLNGREGLVSPSVIILACGGLECARLMLNSDRQDPRGVGNASGFVGLCFMEHPHVAFDSVDVLQPELFAGSAQLHQDNAGRRFMLNFAVDPDIRRSLGILNSRVHAYRTPSMALDSVPKLGVFLEQAPDPASRVLLGTERDAFGLRTLLLDWRLSDAEWLTYRQTQDVFIDAFQRTSLGRRAAGSGIASSPPAILHSNHHLGTTRMSLLQDDGVVDLNCRSHVLENLYIAGGGIFPTGSWANPTFTMLALTLRLADKIKKILKK